MSGTESRVLVVIPARYGSSRFPGKALADLAGEPLIVRTARRAAAMRSADRVVVATDDERIFEAVRAAGLAAEMTGEHETGSDRIGEVAARDGADIVVNLQGDEPLLDPADADRLVEALRRDAAADIATCAHPFACADSWRDPNAVKVLVDRSGFALYFSRAAIPGVFPGREAEPQAAALRHVGIYAYRRAALERFLQLPASELERIEGLEQLRALEDGMRFRVLRIEQAPVGVDTPDDLVEVRRIWRTNEGTPDGSAG
jgi:3-deoxy-manno-octulosonate cytidylyltransferase (CMP-KDO synthetase)